MLKDVSLDQIITSPIALREVDKESEKFQQLVDNVRRLGVLQSVTLRELPSEDGVERYGLVDGLHRYTAALEAGLEKIPANIKSIAEADVLESQMVLNLQKIDTKPVEYSNALKRLLNQNPTLSHNELCQRLNQSRAWLDARLGLTNLHPDIQPLVNEGKIPLSNGFVLSKLPPERQAEYVNAAMTDPVNIFAGVVNKVVKEIKDAARQGRAPKPVEWEPTPNFKSKSDVEAELKNPTNLKRLIAANNISSTEDVIKMALKWMLNIDPEATEVQRAKKVQREAEQAKAKEARKKEAEQKKEAEAAKAQVDLTKI